MNCEQQVRDYLRRQPGATAPEMARTLCYSVSTIYRAVWTRRADVEGRWEGDTRKRYYVREGGGANTEWND